MQQSPRLSLSYVQPAQAQKHVTVNETFRRLDALTQLTVLSQTIAAEPGAPSEGDAYILPASPTGASWGGFTLGNVAAYQDGAWVEITALEGFRAWVSDSDQLVAFDGTNWAQVSGSGGETAAKFGVNATADATNRLSVKSDAVLFNYDDVTPGNDDCIVKVNKKAVADTASQIFQTGASGRAECGLTGDDDFHVKVSADGSSWIEGMIIDKDNGYTKFAGNVGFGGAAPSASYSVNASSAGVGISGSSVLRSSSGQLRVGDSGGWSTVALRPGGTKNVVVTSAGGVTIGSPTGGDKGAGTLNATAVYDDNALLTCYVFDQALDGAIDPAKWDGKVPDRIIEAEIEEIRDPKTGEITASEKTPRRVEVRQHAPMRKFGGRIGSVYDPLTLDGYAKYWREKRHLTSMPNEATFDPLQGLAAGEWIQRLVETVEIQAVLIEDLNQQMKTQNQNRSGEQRP